MVMIGFGIDTQGTLPSKTRRPRTSIQILGHKTAGRPGSATANKATKLLTSVYGSSATFNFSSRARQTGLADVVEILNSGSLAGMTGRHSGWAAIRLLLPVPENAKGRACVVKTPAGSEAGAGKVVKPFMAGPGALLHDWLQCPTGYFEAAKIPDRLQYLSARVQ